jgi:hypothetical protein
MRVQGKMELRKMLSTQRQDISALLDTLYGLLPDSLR